MRVLELPANNSPRKQGQIHGETFRPLIKEIAAIRMELCLALGHLQTTDQLEQLAAQHLPLLQRWLPQTHEELLGIAEAADIPIEHIVVLNHYTDLRDLEDRRTQAAPDFAPLTAERTHKIDIAELPGEEDCSALYARCHEGVFLGQTWDMHGSAAPYVMMMYVPATPDAPAAWMLTITGCLGLAGLNAAGVGVTINNLRSTDAQIGLVWPSLVRTALTKRSTVEARDVILDSPVGSGHHYLIASSQFCYGIETSGTQKKIVFDGVAESYVHTNHCLDQDIAQFTTQAAESTSQERYDEMIRHLRHAPIRQFDDMWVHLGSHNGYPRSVCSHLASVEKPHASRTCGAITMNLSSVYATAAPGCVHRAWPHLFEFEGAT
jgi:isopenicillin-N N-acyltransferase-like protein